MKRYPLTALALLFIQAFSSGMGPKQDIILLVKQGKLSELPALASRIGTTLIGPIKAFDQALLELTTSYESHLSYKKTVTALTPYCSQEGLANALYVAIDNVEADKACALIPTIRQRSSLEQALHYHLYALDPEATPFIQQPYRSVTELIEQANAQRESFRKIDTELKERLHSAHIVSHDTSS